MLSKEISRAIPVFLLAGLVFGACQAPEEDAPPPIADGHLEGRIFPIADTFSIELPTPLAEGAREAFLATAPLASGSRALDARPISPGPGDTPEIVPVEPDFVPGEAVVRLRRSLDATLEALAARPELEAYRFEAGDWATTEILSLRFRRGETIPGIDETLEVAERLQETGLFGYAHPNHYRYGDAVPNDQRYDRTWHLHMLDMEAAWEITTGSPDVVIAVIDSGVREHEDLGRLLPGYDFITSPDSAGDGDGRDPDPSPVDKGRSTYHGQHVAGTIAADGNNGIGIPGMDWKAKILPVRALGVYGFGTSIDVMASIVWATGGEVPGAPTNPHPADVLNLSLGGSHLVPAEQEVIDIARAGGATIVVAAGNDNADARDRSFSGYAGVIVVGAVDVGGRRAPYSNFGPAVDVMAPGGNIYADENADGLPDGVYSLWFRDGGATDTYRFNEGTSMATPHVSGLVGLMKAIEPSLTPDRVGQILRDTARAEFQCRDGCGAGLIDPVRALMAAQGQGQNETRLRLPLERLDLGPRSEAVIPLRNEGNAPLAWHARLEGPIASALSLSQSAGTIPGSADRNLRITAERRGLKEGRHEATLSFISPEGRYQLPISLSVGHESADLGVARIMAVAFPEASSPVVGGMVATDASEGYAFSLSVRPGTWYLAATVDRDGDGQLGAGDLLGFWPSNEAPEAIEVEEDGLVEELEFILEPVAP